MKNIRVEVDDKQHSLLKAILAAEGLSIADFIRLKVKEKLEGK